jgi:RNA polymerase sigma-70 factor (ECF subfamily)
MMRTEDFERLYEAHAASLLAFLEYRTGNMELARDVHADTFERILKTRWRFDSRRGSERTWVYAIALNVLRDQGRRRAAEARALDRVTAGGSDEHWDEADRLDDRDAVRRGLATLPDDEREAVSLYYGADLSLEEIARITGTRTTTIKGRLARGRDRLRETLGDR